MNTMTLMVWGQITTRLARVVTLLGLLLATSSSALAINLGDLNITSGKHTPFAATILVKDYDPAEIDQLQVSLASPEIHRRLGIPLTAEINTLQFSPQLSAGLPIIKISADAVIQQAQDKLALDVRWPQGKLMIMYDLNIPQPSAEWVAYRAEQADADTRMQAADIQTAKHAKPLLAKQTDTHRDHTTVTIQDGITLWKIASNAVPNEDVSVNQVMLAILALNPNSFEFNNVNSLQARTELKIPNHLDFAYSKKEAELEIKRQHEEWRRVQDTVKKPASAFASETYSEATARLSQSDSGTMSDPDLGQQQSQPTTAHAELTSESANEVEHDAVEEIELSAAATDRQQSYLQAQIEPLPDWQQLPAIAAPELSPAENTLVDTNVKDDGDAQLTRVDVTASIPNVISQGWAQVLTQMSDLVRSTQFANYQQQSSDYWQQHQQLIILMLIILMLLSIGYRLGRNTRDESPIAPTDQSISPLTAREVILSEINASRDFSIQAEAVAAGSPASYEGDFALDSPSPTTQRGILDEVDIYLSYGLYLEALDLLNAAVAQSPQHVGYLLKLAETHCLADNPEAFLKQADKLSELVTRDSLAWKKLTELAEKIVPEHVLFSSPKQPQADDLQQFPADEFELENLTQSDNPQAPASAPADATYADELDHEDNATKLDLAKIYIDMEDHEAARDILLTVLKEGTPTQRAEAHRLSLEIT